MRLRKWEDVYLDHDGNLADQFLVSVLDDAVVRVLERGVQAAAVGHVALAALFRVELLVAGDQVRLAKLRR